MSTELGVLAETKAAKYLRSRGYEIVDRNWRTRWCEIDMVTKKAGIIYFVEVKYRSSTTQGSGLDYITNTKLSQMHFAAELWLSSNAGNADYRLAALELTGSDFSVTAWVDDI